MARGAYTPKNDDEGIESRAMGDDAYMQSLLANGNVDEFIARTSFPLDTPHGRYSLEDLRRDNLARGRATFPIIVSAAMAHVGHALQEARKRARLTQRQAAQAYGCSVNTIQRIESGEKVPSLEQVLELSWLYGAHVERVLGLIDERAEHLLNVYEAATKSNRASIVEVAEKIQASEHGGGTDRYAERIEFEADAHLREAHRRMGISD